MKTPIDIKNPATGSSLEAAIVQFCQCDGIQSAVAEWKSHQERKKAQENEREERRRLKRQKGERCKVAAMLGGIWASMELSAGRLVGDFRELSPGVLRTICHTLKMESGENAQSLPDAMPFPAEKLLSYAVNLPPEERDVVAAICAAMPNRAPSNRKTQAKPEYWLCAPAKKIVDLSLMSSAEAKKRAENLAGAIEKYLQRESFVLVEDGAREVAEFVQEYLGRIRAVSPQLAGAFNKLSQAFSTGKVEETVFMGYLLQVPVLPPKEVRFLFRKKILWVTQNDAS